MNLLSQPRRAPRSGEWTPQKAVTFIVTLAAHRNVTLAGRASGMSRKSAYALKTRDPAFAAAWTAAVEASAKRRVEGDKVDEVDRPSDPLIQGDMSPSRRDSERHFSRLLASLRDSPPLAPHQPAQ